MPLKQNKPLVSVLIPCYNHEKYIGDTIKSVLTQSVESLEVLVADDCSPDGSYTVAKGFSDPRLHVWHFSKNQGTVSALNFLLEQAQGDFIATLGSDDLFYPQKLEKQLAVLRDKPHVAAVFSWADMIDENGRPYTSGASIGQDTFCRENCSRAEWCRFFLENGNALCHSSALIRSTVQRELGTYHAEYRQLHDFEMWLRLVCRYEFEIIPQPLLAYRRAQEGTASISGCSAENSRRLYNEYAFLFPHFVDEMPADVFCTAFSDKLRRPLPLSPDDVIMEKFFVLQSLSFWDQPLPAAALAFLAPHLHSKDFIQNMEEHYSFTLKDYYAATGEAAICYPAAFATNVSALEQRLEDERSARRQSEQALKQRICAYEQTVREMEHSTSWRLTAPIRKWMMRRNNLKK